MAAKPIEIDLRRDLPKVRAQRDALVERIGSCLYSAPCAIGAMMSEDDRKRLSGSSRDETAIRFLLGGSVTMPKDQWQDAIDIQQAFDGGNVARFDEMLVRLEAKYLAKARADA